MHTWETTHVQVSKLKEESVLKTLALEKSPLAMLLQILPLMRISSLISHLSLRLSINEGPLYTICPPIRLMLVTRFPCEGTVWEFWNPEEVKLWWRKRVAWGKRVSIDGLAPLFIDCCFLALSVICPSGLQRPPLCLCCRDGMGPLNCEPNKCAIPQSALIGHFAAEQDKWLLLGTSYSAIYIRPLPSCLCKCQRHSVCRHWHSREWVTAAGDTKHCGTFVWQGWARKFARGWHTTGPKIKCNHWETFQSRPTRLGLILWSF